MGCFGVNRGARPSQRQEATFLPFLPLPLALEVGPLHFLVSSPCRSLRVT